VPLAAPTDHPAPTLRDQLGFDVGGLQEREGQVYIIHFSSGPTLRRRAGSRAHGGRCLENGPAQPQKVGYDAATSPLKRLLAVMSLPMAIGTQCDSILYGVLAAFGKPLLVVNLQVW